MLKLLKYTSAFAAGLIISGASFSTFVAAASGETEIYEDVSENTAAISDNLGWVYDNDGKAYYYGQDGQKYTGIHEISGSIYYFESNGAMKKGWFTVDGIRRYFDLNTDENKTGWIDYMNQRFYADSEKGKLTGIKQRDGKTFVFNENGELLTGWFEYDGNKYYSGEDGEVFVGDCIVDGIKYIFSPKGKLQSGWQTVDGKRVFYDYDTALPVYGWVYYNGYVYYTASKKGKYTGEYEIYGLKYRFSENGCL